MTAITTAVRLLREAATELKKSHTLNGDWGNEHDALTAYNAHIAAAADLERIAPQCLAQIQEPAAVAGPAWSKTRDSLAMLLLGLASNPNLSLDVACIALDTATESGMPLAYLRGAPAAPALEAPAAPSYRAEMGIAGRDYLQRTLGYDPDLPFAWADLYAAMLAAAPQAPAAPSIPQWIDDPHDIEQGQMLNPAWTQAQAAPVAPAVGAIAAVDENGRHVRIRAEEIEQGKQHARYLLALLERTMWTDHCVQSAQNEWQAATTCEALSTLAKAALASATPLRPAPAVDASDTARLEWLVKEDNCVVNEGVNGCWVCWIDEQNPDGTEYQKGSFPTFRAAIDAARAAQAKEGGAA